MRIRSLHLFVWLAGSVSVSPSPEERFFLLLVKPAQELLEANICLNLLNRIERVAQFIVRPCFVDEILAGMAGRGNVPSAFAARHDMVSARRHLAVTKCASVIHIVGPMFPMKIFFASALENFEPLAGLFHQHTLNTRTKTSPEIYWLTVKRRISGKSPTNSN
jgi:hypothetical protein